MRFPISITNTALTTYTVNVKWGLHLCRSKRGSVEEWYAIMWVNTHILWQPCHWITCLGLGLETLSQDLCLETKTKTFTNWARMFSRPETLVSTSRDCTNLQVICDFSLSVMRSRRHSEPWHDASPSSLSTRRAAHLWWDSTEGWCKRHAVTSQRRWRPTPASSPASSALSGTLCMPIRRWVPPAKYPCPPVDCPLSSYATTGIHLNTQNNFHYAYL